MFFSEERVGEWPTGTERPSALRRPFHRSGKNPRLRATEDSRFRTKVSVSVSKLAWHRKQYLFRFYCFVGCYFIYNFKVFSDISYLLKIIFSAWGHTFESRSTKEFSSSRIQFCGNFSFVAVFSLPREIENVTKKPVFNNWKKIGWKKLFLLQRWGDQLVLLFAVKTSNCVSTEKELNLVSLL